MRTSALLLSVALVARAALADGPALAAAAPQEAATPSWLEAGLHGEVTVVGLTYGVRGELLFRLGPPGVASRLRLSLGVLGGPDQVFMPVSLGYRAVYRQHATVRPLFGVGLEVQHRLVSDADLVRQYGVYLEGGVAFALTPRLSLGALLGLDVMVFGGPGVGLGPRAFLTWRL